MLSVNSSDAIDFSRPTYDVVAFYQADPVGGGAGKGLHVYNETDARYLLNILEGGNVGIGTINPTARLTVSGGVVINEEGYGYNDVRMEGDTDSALFFLDASADMVGIGTLTPTTKLEVVGTISGSTLVGSDLRNCSIVTTSANGTLTCGTGDMLDQSEADDRYVNVSGDTMTGALTIKKTAGTSTGNTLVVDTKGLVYDATNKRVGIGTASPDNLLTLDKPSGNVLIQFNSNGTIYGYIGTSSAVDNPIVGMAAGDLGFRTQSKKMSFSNNNGNSVQVMIDTAGNVGIGDTTPSTKLDVAGGITGTSLRLTSLTSCAVLITNSNGTLSCGTGETFVQSSADARYVNVSGDTMTGALTIKKTSGTATGNTLIVDTTGLVYDATNKRVGIGTASPRTALEVLGAISGSSLSIRDSITGSGVLVIQGATTLKSTLAVTGNVTTQGDLTL